MSISKENRKLAYDSIKDDLGKRHRQVIKAIAKLGTATCSEICKEAKLPINIVVARVNELYNSDKIDPVGSKLNPRTMRQNTVYSIVEKPDKRKSYRRSVDFKKGNKAKKLIRLFSKFESLEGIGNQLLEHEKIEQIMKVL